MDEYRSTLLGRALADVLQEMEMEGTLEEAESDLLFDLFDEAMRYEFAVAEPKNTTTKRAAPSLPQTAPSTPAVQLFTHKKMEITGGVYAFNRYMDKWSLYAAVDTAIEESFRLDGVPVDFTLGSQSNQAELLVKLHDPRPEGGRRKKS